MSTAVFSEDITERRPSTPKWLAEREELDAIAEAKSQPREQTLQQIEELYPALRRAHGTVERLKDLLAMLEFTMIHREWVTEDSGHRYGFNLDFNGAETPESMFAAMLKELMRFSVDTPHHLVLMLHYVEHSGEFYLYYKAIATNTGA